MVEVEFDEEKESRESKKKDICNLEVTKPFRVDVVLLFRMNSSSSDYVNIKIDILVVTLSSFFKSCCSTSKPTTSAEEGKVKTE